MNRDMRCRFEKLSADKEAWGFCEPMPSPKQSEPSPKDRRKEHRYPIEAKVIVHRKGGESFSAKMANVSSSGMLIQTDDPTILVMDELVSVEVELPEKGNAFSSWGIARVARVTGLEFGLQLLGGTYESGMWRSF